MTAARDESVVETLRTSRPVHAALAIAAVTLATLGMLETRLAGLRHRSLTKRVSDEASIPSVGTIRILSLGHREWAADLLWSASLVYFGETLVSHQQQRYLQQYAETLEQIDPHFRQAYLWGATVSVYNARAIRRDS